MCRHPLTPSRYLLAVLGIAGAALHCSASAEAAFLTEVYGFRDLTNGSNVVVPSDYVVEVSNWKDDAGVQTELSNQVRFRFRNIGSLASSYIDGAYFDDGALLGIAEIVNGTGVRFDQKVTPPELPGANLLDPDFRTTKGFLADVVKNAADGVNPGEHVDIIFDLKDDPLGSGNYLTFQDVIDSLHNGQHLDPSDNSKPYTVLETFKVGKGLSLRIGLQVQGLANEGSDQLVNTARVPGPSTAVLASMGILCGCGCGWRRRREQVQAAA